MAVYAVFEFKESIPWNSFWGLIKEEEMEDGAESWTKIINKTMISCSNWKG